MSEPICNDVSDTIVAAASPPGTGGVAVIRLSGNDATSIAAAIAGPLPDPRHAVLRRFRAANGDLLDHGLLLWFRGPHSYTGENVVELHGHGGPVPVEQLLSAAVVLGARRAGPGEFSRRAFLNDKLDLTQAEAVADLIGSGTIRAARAALRSLSGEFSAAVEALAAQLVTLRMHVEAAIDFPEEDIDFLDDQALTERIRTCTEAFDTLQRRATTGRLLRDGLQVAIVGRPNAGKSSLMNRLSGEDTAIVTELAGTTRDILRECIDIDGLPVELVDTAGLRDAGTAGRIEAEGIRRAERAMERADVIVWVQDASSGDAGDLPETRRPGVPLIVVHNKIDLDGEAATHDIGPPTLVRLSAKTGEGIDLLRGALASQAGHGDAAEGSFSARQRHLDALAAARTRFDTGCEALRTDRAGELLAEELRLAHEALGEITGRMSSDELLGRIFAGFCIGK